MTTYTITPKGVILAAILESLDELADMTGTETPDLLIATIALALDDAQEQLSLQFGIDLASTHNMPVTSFN